MSKGEWTAERVGGLSRQEVLQLQANAVRLGEHGLGELCARRLAELPAGGPAAKPNAARRLLEARLVPRNKAFAARGIWLTDPRSWSGIRTSDGAAVFALWSGSVRSEDGGCRYLLWAPNIKGGRAWSDTQAGQERLAHCKAALQRGAAEGLLVRGEPLEGWLPEERAKTVLGVDPEVVIALRVEQRGPEYWAAW